MYCAERVVVLLCFLIIPIFHHSHLLRYTCFYYHVKDEARIQLAAFYSSIVSPALLHLLTCALFAAGTHGFPKIIVSENSSKCRNLVFCVPQRF